MARLFVLLTSIMLSSCSSLDSHAIVLPDSETQRSFTLNLSISTQELYEAYMSRDVNQRRLAEMYVAGVLDSTEGKVWCGYKIVSPGAIQEQVFLGLKETLKNNPKLRASDAIRVKLEKLLPCKESQ